MAFIDLREQQGRQSAFDRSQDRLIQGIIGISSIVEKKKQKQEQDIARQEELTRQEEVQRRGRALQGLQFSEGLRKEGIQIQDPEAFQSAFQEGDVTGIQKMVQSAQQRKPDGLSLGQLKLAEQREKTKQAKIQTGILGMKGQQIELDRKQRLSKPIDASKLKSNQFIAATFGERTKQANQIFDELQQSGFNRAEASTGLQKFLPEVLKPEELKKQEQAERNFVNAVLRRESGAAIAESEFDSAEKQYFPRAGDSAQVLKQKQDNRNLVMSGLLAEAGQASQLLQQQFAALPQQAAPQAPSIMESVMPSAVAQEPVQQQQQQQLPPDIEANVPAFAQQNNISLEQAREILANRINFMGQQQPQQQQIPFRPAGQ